MSIAQWCGVEVNNVARLGQLSGHRIRLFEGGLFENPTATDDYLNIADAI